jgi:predicted phage terminase large subunit-like protein
MQKGNNTMSINQKQFQWLLRHDFAAFSEGGFRELNPQKEYMRNWHLQVVAATLEQCRTGKLKRLIINVPPRSLKSHMASICFPAYLLGHNAAARIVCASYAQDLADNLAGSCRTLMMSKFYRDIFPATRLASTRQAIHDFKTTMNGGRLSTSVGGVLTGRGGDFIIIDDPLKPEEAYSDAQRQAVNDWYDHTLISRLDNKATGCIIVIMQRLHEDDLVGHLSSQPDWKILRFPAIAEEDETHVITTPYGPATYTRRQGEALHPERESLEILCGIENIQGSYNFNGQYQQRPAPLGGGMVKLEWFKSYAPHECPEEFEQIFQSWDTANKTSDRNDYSVCTTWGVSDKHLYLLDVLCDRLDYPTLRRRVRTHTHAFGATNILIEDKASGTQLIQDLIDDGVHSTTPYQTKMDKISRMSTASSMIENGFVHIPARADWLDAYRHELSIFPNGQYDDQVDSTSQALDWIKQGMSTFWFEEQAREEYLKLPEAARIELGDPVGLDCDQSQTSVAMPQTSACEKCGNTNLSRCCVQGVSGDVEESCVCGWSRRTSRPTKVRAAIGHNPLGLSEPSFLAPRKGEAALR